jgi:transcription termination/antitermination protein NusG
VKGRATLCWSYRAFEEEAAEKVGRTEGGEALLETTGAKWRALWTHSHSEQLVHDQLAAKGFQPFLPKMEIWSRRRGEQHPIRVPMFPGYLFLNHTLDKAAYLQVCQVRGLVRVLGERWDRLAEIPDSQIDAVQRVAGAGRRVLPHPYLAEGRRVRILRGPLRGVEGLLTSADSAAGTLVVSIELLQRSVSIDIDCTDVEPA